MKKFITILVLITGCFVFLIVNFKQVIAPINDTVHQIVVPGPVEVLPDPVVLVLEVQQLNKLETASLTLEKIVRATRDNDRLAGVFGETILFVAVGKVVAGIDLSKLNDFDIEVISSDTVKIHLPSSEIFDVILDNKKSYMAYRGKGVFAQTDSRFETVVRDQSQEALKKNAIESEILHTADINAQDSVRKLLEKLGLKKIEFI